MAHQQGFFELDPDDPINADDAEDGGEIEDVDDSDTEQVRTSLKYVSFS